ncbi:MAG TPA: hypothetical protein VEP48_10455, partial [Methylomirabilota bacterium]|nr:hypothetical protein [Methylomirabilota bacterium]
MGSQISVLAVFATVVVACSAAAPTGGVPSATVAAVTATPDVKPNVLLLDAAALADARKTALAGGDIAGLAELRKEA